MGRMACMVQAVRRGSKDFRTFRRIMADLLADIKKRGEPPETDTTIAAHLLRIRDPHTGTMPPPHISTHVATPISLVSVLDCVRQCHTTILHTLSYRTHVAL